MSFDPHQLMTGPLTVIRFDNKLGVRVPSGVGEEAMRLPDEGNRKVVMEASMAKVTTVDLLALSLDQAYQLCRFSDLSLEDLVTLGTLLRASPITAGRLAKLMHVTPAAVTVRLQRVSMLIAIRDNHLDRRGKLFGFTPAALQTLALKLGL